MQPTQPRSIRSLPATPGVYRFRDAGGRVLYIGRATDLRHRVASYWSDLGERGHLARMVRRVDRIEAVACDSQHEAAWLERNLLDRAMPRWNRAGGPEVPVYIRMDVRPRTASLTVEHLLEPQAGVRWFGPYLGGLRVRNAVSGLERILPLGYAAAGLRGSALDMARVRGVAATDHAWIVDALVAVLERHPDAVERARAAIRELRDRAADALAFEHAARISAESEAIDWITSRQRVTTETAGDLDAYGWADGILVHYAVRAGRLSEWSQRASSASRASAYLAATPDAWLEFAQRNAELAAALRTGGDT
jgi:excinuclease ABC subunit C